MSFFTSRHRPPIQDVDEKKTTSTSTPTTATTDDDTKAKKDSDDKDKALAADKKDESASGSNKKEKEAESEILHNPTRVVKAQVRSSFSMPFSSHCTIHSVPFLSLIILATSHYTAQRLTLSTHQRYHTLWHHSRQRYAIE